MIKKLIVVILALLMTACGVAEPMVKPTLNVMGDVSEVSQVRNFLDLPQQKITVKENTYDAITLKALIDASNAVGEDFDVLIESTDGVSAKVDYDDTDKVFLYIDSDNHWCAYTEEIPIQTKIRHIENLVLIANKLNHMQKCFRIIGGFEDYEFSYGDLYFEDSIESIIDEGEATKNDVTVGVYKKRKLIPLANYHQSAETCLGYFADGSQQELDPNGYLLHRGNTVDYIFPDRKTTINDIIGVWFDYPEKGIEYIGQYALNHKDEKLMIIELDGYGMTAHNKFMPEFLGTIKPEKMRTVMPSVSNVALATFVTGKLPNETGIRAKGERELKVDDIFNGRDDAIVVEGNSMLITMSIDQHLSLDENENGTNDDEVYKNSIEELKNNPNLIFIHFHGFDDVAHTYGPYSDEAHKKIIELDGYVKDLAERFDGKIFVVSDHGQHERTFEGRIGNHGEFIYEDMVTPFFTIGG